MALHIGYQPNLVEISISTNLVAIGVAMAYTYGPIDFQQFNFFQLTWEIAAQSLTATLCSRLSKFCILRQQLR